MFKTLIAQLLHHITNQNNWSRKHLAPYAGKTVQLNIALFKSTLIILEDGSISIATDNAKADASIHISPSLALRLLAKDEAAKMHIKMDGDAQLAAEFGKILQSMKWDFEEDLSKIIGDIPANKTISIGKKVLENTKKQSINIVEMLAEFWQEEKPVLAKKWRVDKFNCDVDTLNSDFNRLEKRLEKLAQRNQESSAT